MKIWKIRTMHESMQPMRSPKVSIIIPVYNGSNYLRDSIHCAIHQTYPNIEVIVVNDGSNDGQKTKKIAESFGNKIRYFEKENGGVATALNFAISQMTGEYFSWLSHDDLFHLNKIELQVKHIQKFKEPVISFTDIEIIDENTKIIGQNCVHNYKPNEFIPHLLMNNFLHGCALLIPKICFQTCGVFNEKLMTTNDYDLWFRMAKHFSFQHLPMTLIQSRTHQNQTSQLMNIQHRNECNNLYIHTMNDLIINQKEYRLPLTYFAKLSVILFKNDYKEAASHAYDLFKQMLPKHRSLLLPPFYLTRLFLKLYSIKKFTIKSRKIITLK